MDRRVLIAVLSLIGGIGAFLSVVNGSFVMLLISSTLVGGTANPLYALLLAYANDFLDRSDMAGASGGFLFINGLGAISGPLIVGWAMDTVGAQGYWSYMGILMIGLSIYAFWRMTRRSSTISVEDTSQYAPIMPSATPVALEVAQEVYLDADQNEEEAQS
jgi:MFS family permease